MNYFIVFSCNFVSYSQKHRDAFAHFIMHSRNKQNLYCSLQLQSPVTIKSTNETADHMVSLERFNCRETHLCSDLYYLILTTIL